MKKFLYATTALIGAAFITEAASAAITVNGQYRGAYVLNSPDDKRSQTDDADEDFGANDRNNKYVDVTRLSFTGKKESANGLTTQFFMQFRGEESGGGSGGGGDTIANAYGSVEGAFGKVQLGDYAPAGYGLGVYGTPFSANFGVNDPNVRVANKDIITLQTAVIAGYRNKQIGYFTPDISGFQGGITFAPDGGTGGGPRDTVSQSGEIVEALSLGGIYSNSYGGVSITIGGGFAQGTYTPKALTLGSDNVVLVGGPNVGEPSTSNVIQVTAGVQGTDAAEVKAAGERTTPKVKTVARRSNEVIWGDDLKAATFATDLGVTAVAQAAQNADDGTTGALANAAATAARNAIAIASNEKHEEEPTAFNFGVSFGVDQFTFGGSYGQSTAANTNETTAYALGASYNVDALTFGIGWATQTVESSTYTYTVDVGVAALTGDNILTEDKISGTTVAVGSKKNAEKTDTILTFTAEYQIGDGASVDFAIETHEYEEKNNADADLSDSGFGIGLNLSF